MMKTILYKLTSLVVVLMCFTVQAIAQFEEGRELQPVQGLPALTGTTNLSNGATNTVLYTPASEASRNIINIISLKIKEGSTAIYFASNFIATATLDLEFTDAASTITTSQITLTVNYDTTTGATYKLRDYKTYKNFVKVKVTLHGDISITGGTGWNPKDILEVENEIRVTQYFTLSATTADLVPTFITSQPTPDVLKVNWTFPSGAHENMSQLEYAYVENEMLDYYNSDYNLLFQSNSTRIDLDYANTGYSFKIPLLYTGPGKLYYRARAVQRKSNGTLITGAWSTVSETVNSFAFTGHEPDLNWQSSSTFAEQGKYKSVIQYFDGSLRSRQTVTKDNSTGNTVVAETIYDLQGRANIQILPTPTIDNTIKYFSGFNRFKGMSATEDPAKYFDLTPEAVKCGAALSLDSNYGNGRYYSNQNDWLATESKSKYIPDAQGYAYTETRFTDDATQRVVIQGGVGIDHQIGSGHETKYYYGKPSQPELDALFGTEAGDASHYSKNMVKDANGQMSVSYTDMHGRTVATALAGDPTPGIDSIINNTDYPLATGVLRNDLLTPATNIIQGNSIVSVNTIMASALTSYNFTYKLNPDILHLLSCTSQPICFDCKYDLEISIKGENCGNDVPVVKRYNNLQIVAATNSCDNSMGFTGEGITTPVTQIDFDTTLSTGSYIIRKTLTINDSLFQMRRDSVLKVLLCKTRDSIYNTIYDSLALISGCSATPTQGCDSCIAKLGTFAIYKAKYLVSIAPNTATDLVIYTQYKTDSTECSLTCSGGFNPQFATLKGLRDQMLADMIPFTGQYAIPEDSIINPVTHVKDLTRFESKFNIFSDRYYVNGTGSPIYTGKPYFNKPQNENGQPYYYTEDNVIDNTIHGTIDGTTHIIDTIHAIPFAGIFQNSWAASLIKYHPEYSKLQYAETTMKATYDWLDAVQNCTSYATAVTKGYAVPVKISTSTINDPYFLLTGTSADKDTLDHQLYTGISYLGASPTIWQIANSSVLCTTVDSLHKYACITATTPTGMDPLITNAADQDAVWEKFKTLYFSYRNDMVVRYITNHAPAALPQTDMNRLIKEGKQLVFARTADIAGQNRWGWWQYATNPHDTIGLGGSVNDYLDNNAIDICQGQRPFWKARLLQCEVFRAMLSLQATADSVWVNTIINTILDSMVMICHNSVTPLQPYGASTVNPAYTGTPRKFEDVINNVFAANGITTIPTNYFCNPYTIDFPKPFGLTPPVSINYTNTLDSCACRQFSVLKGDAGALGYDPLNFTSMNQFLLANYNDTLTLVLWNGLQNCGSMWQDTCAPVKHALTSNANAFAKGATTSLETTPCANCILTVTSRAQYGHPEHYIAKCEIDFLPGFESDAIDSFDAVINTLLPSCDTMPCVRPVINSIIQSGAALVDIHINYQLPANCDSCRLIIYDQNNDLYGVVNGICGTSGINYSLPTACSIFRFLIKCQTDSCGLLVSDTTNYSACDTIISHCLVYHPIILDASVPLPPFFNCGYIKPCISCTTLNNILTPEFRALYPAYSGVPYLDSTTTDDQAKQNALWARFLNFRTGFSKTALDYMAAYKNCSGETPPVNAICSFDKPINDPSDLYPPHYNPCEQTITEAQFLADLMFTKLKDSLVANFDSLYKAKCLAAQSHEEFYVTYQPKEYHYTLYYYDQAGNLVKTLPPAAVKPNYGSAYLAAVASNRVAGTDYTNPNNNAVMATEYRYNSLNQVVAQHTPDAGLSKFWYDRLGRLVVSQNSKQLAANKYSYTLYDVLGRITQVGQKPQTQSISQSVTQDATALQNWLDDVAGGGSLKEQITRTVYDVPYYGGEAPPTLEPVLVQKNLRNRVSYSQVIDAEPSDFKTNAFAFLGLQSAATYYSYDIHGNVDTLVQDLKGALGWSGNNRYKKMVYDYDLISGKVNEVKYQPGQTDQFYHRYLYDDENRITGVATSHDSIYWETEAGYEYYRHGPLSRTVLGQNHVQGIDYAYTIQGWLKGVNSSSVNSGINDIGEDGKLGGINPVTARDVFGYSLNYFDGDYKPIGGTAIDPFVSITGSLPVADDGVILGKDLFNGNIRAMMVNVPKLGEAKLYGYRYDQLNRIRAMNSFNGFDTTSNSFGSGGIPTVTNDYKERVTYDPNGNIKDYLRNGISTQAGGDMDDLNYAYNIDGSGNLQNNRLRHVKDAVADGNYTGDIDSQSDDNYSYDAIGNLTGDVKEGISNISWSVYGKILNITKTDGTTIAYSYDAVGNRINKTVTAGGIAKTTTYVRDASGNVMSLYVTDAAVNSGALTQTEISMYGSSRLGVFNINRPVNDIAAIDYSAYSGNFIRGEKFFELTNHLGNVLATITDKKKLGIVRQCINYSRDGSCQIYGSPEVQEYFEAEVATANDYYPFGMVMPGRKYEANSGYRYGFNGQEKSDEIAEGFTTAQYWEYDSRIGRRWNMDPIVKEWESPYATFGNSPILMTDPLGLDWYKNNKTGNVEYRANWHKRHKGFESLGKGNGDWLNYEGKDYNKKTGEVSSTLESVTVTGTRKKNNSLMEQALQVSNVTRASLAEYDARPKPSYYDPNPLKTIFWDASVGSLNPIKDIDIYISANIKHKTELKTFAPVTFSKYQPSATVVWAGLQGGVTTKDGQGLYGNLVTGDVSYVSLKVDGTGTEIRGLPFKGLGVNLSVNKGAMYGEYSPQLRILQDTKVRIYGIPIQAELGMGRSQAPTIGLRGKLETPTVLGFSAEVTGGVRASLQWPALIRAIFGN